MIFTLLSGRRAPASERSITGLEAHLERGAILWFGEVHGTEESPRFAGDVSCHAAHTGCVQLGLEIANDEQVRIDRYVRSDGNAPDRAALLEGDFWRQHDGRSSEAMVALIERVRVLRAAGAAIDVVAYDIPGATDRDAAMADYVARTRDPQAVFIGLSGNIHSRRTKGTPWNPDLVPMVARLVARGFVIATFDVAANGGTFWGCISDGPEQPLRCSEHENRCVESGEPWTLGPALDPSHDGVYRVGTTTASRPALGT
jgi:hypothetical protein